MHAYSPSNSPSLEPVNVWFTNLGFFCRCPTRVVAELSLPLSDANRGAMLWIEYAAVRRKECCSEPLRMLQITHPFFSFLSAATTALSMSESSEASESSAVFCVGVGVGVGVSFDGRKRSKI